MNKTVFTAYEQYLGTVTTTNISSKLTSIFIRFLIPEWGGNTRKGNRSTPQETIEAKEFLKTLSINKLQGSFETLERCLINMNIEKSIAKDTRSVYKKFYNYVLINYKNDLVGNSKQDNKQEPEIIKRSPNGERKTKYANSKHHNITYKKPFALMAKYKNNKQYPTGNLIYSDDYINEKLNIQLTSFFAFREEKFGCTPATLEKDKEVIFRFFGWLRRFKGVSSEELSLNSIISFHKLNIKITECLNENQEIDYNKLSLQRAIARQTASDKADEDRNLIQEYINFIGGSPGTRFIAVQTCISLAKFIFKDEIGYNKLSEREIPVIIKLRDLATQLNKLSKLTPQTVPHSKKSIPWLTLLDILEKSRNTFLKNKVLRPNGSMYTREAKAMYNDLQRFLSLAFMALMPPDRSRTYCILELGRTFVKGIYQNNKFTPENKLMNLQKIEVYWYIHLEPGDYKTGKTYGEWWGQVPNVPFPDGTFLYEYIDKWLNEGREYEKPLKHNYVFTKTRLGTKLSSDCWYGRIKIMIFKETGIAVTPKELRKMYVTFLKDSGATEAELEAAAYWMHHSRRMQSQIYDEQDRINKMAPIHDFNKRIAEKFFKSSH
ncbi:MAG: hypothetical protein KME38_30760 [Spirirestis rafaelensis WJT71-NPBG6]|jgi:hypothetical protein|nr:hypothetical protein [Spirirestis rafaelensis WJT71-NPBG6]